MPQHAIITFRLELAGGTEEFPVGPSELFHYGRRYPGSTVEQVIATGGSEAWEHILFLCWRSARRRQVTTDDLETWVDTLEGIDLDDLRAQAADLVAVVALPLANGASPPA